MFELWPTSGGGWAEIVLYNFCTNIGNGLCLDGRYPVAGLVFDQAGNLYGTTTYGGAGPCGSQCGTVFELSPPSSGDTWAETVLYSFCAGSNNRCQDGAEPAGQVTFDPAGNLYGTTVVGGTGPNGRSGTVFELSPNANGWTHTTLYNFCGNGQGEVCPDGARPQAGVTFDKAGNLYGTTEAGGGKESQGSGTVYELSPKANGWTETVLARFITTENLQIPLGTVSFDPAGNLYSTASAGLSGVFELMPKTRTERTFHFDGTNGYGPAAGVLIDLKAKALYGTTVGSDSGNGVVFKIAESGEETVLYNFCQQTNCVDGQNPYGGLIEDEAGNLYGTTKFGGVGCDGAGCGVVFEIVQSNQ